MVKISLTPCIVVALAAVLPAIAFSTDVDGVYATRDYGDQYDQVSARDIMEDYQVAVREVTDHYLSVRATIFPSTRALMSSTL